MKESNKYANHKSADFKTLQLNTRIIQIDFHLVHFPPIIYHYKERKTPRLTSKFLIKSENIHPCFYFPCGLNKGLSIFCIPRYMEWTAKLSQFVTNPCQIPKDDHANQHKANLTSFNKYRKPFSSFLKNIQYCSASKAVQPLRHVAKHLYLFENEACFWLSSCFKRLQSAIDKSYPPITIHIFCLN